MKPSYRPAPHVLVLIGLSLVGGLRAESTAEIPNRVSLWQAYEKARHAVRPVEGEAHDSARYGIQNPAQGFSARFSPEGMTLEVQPQAGRTENKRSYRSQWRTLALGYGADLAPLAAGEVRKDPSREDGDRVEIVRPELVEWFVNRRDGLEQGWTLPHPPQGRESGEPLRLQLGVEGELRARVGESGQEVSLINSEGKEVLNYRHLKVWDASGREFPARLLGGEGSLIVEVEETEAVYPLVIDPVFVQQAYLKATNPGAADNFGYSVAVSGNTAVVGAPFEDNAAGAAYVFVKGVGGAWSPQAYLKAANSDASDEFGWSVAISGNTLVVGARCESSAVTGVNQDGSGNGANMAGAAYVFVRGAGGAWTQQAYLKASNTNLGDEFGYSVAIQGDTIVVGAPREDSANLDQGNNSAAEAGAVYVFVRVGGVWGQQAYLKATNPGPGDHFGYSISISGNTVLVGAPFEDSASMGVNADQSDNTASNAGAAYVFVRNAVNVWNSQAYLKASNTGTGDWFGGSVSISGNSAVVGANNESSNAVGVNGNEGDNSAAFAGAAYVFARFGTDWGQQAYLKASNTQAGDQFGRPVAISGNRIVVAAPIEGSAATGVNGDQNNNGASSAGAVYVFERTGVSFWRQEAYLKASNTDAWDEFGRALAIDGNTIVVGAPYEDSISAGVNGNQSDNSANDVGAAYVFSFPPPRLKMQKPKRFSATLVGRKSRPQKLRLTNSGGSPLVNLRVSLSGRAKGDYKVSKAKLGTLSEGGSVRIKLTFRPRGPGARKAKITATGTEVSSVKHKLKGNGKAAP